MANLAPPHSPTGYKKPKHEVQDQNRPGCGPAKPNRKETSPSLQRNQIPLKRLLPAASGRPRSNKAAPKDPKDPHGPQLDGGDNKILRTSRPQAL